MDTEFFFFFYDKFCICMDIYQQWTSEIMLSLCVNYTELYQYWYKYVFHEVLVFELNSPKTVSLPHTSLSAPPFQLRGTSLGRFWLSVLSCWMPTSCNFFMVKMLSVMMAILFPTSFGKVYSGWMGLISSLSVCTEINEFKKFKETLRLELKHCFYWWTTQ